MSVKLSLDSLGHISSTVSKPTYLRSDLSPGIVHIGTGNFHRAHQALYLHRLFEMGIDFDWAIIGSGIKRFDEAMRNRLKPQDWLTTVVELDPVRLSATVSGPMIDFIPIDPQMLIETMAQPNIRIVSLTVTEGGYFVDAESGGFNHQHPDIIADIEYPDSPKTVFGIIIAALMKRREAGIPAFTVMSCDNLSENGHVARRTMLGLAKNISDESHDWIASNVTFPNSMVDCITPATGDRERSIVRDKFGIEDSAPVVCEPFHQWVLEDNFANGRPALEKVGVQFVEDVAPYELMKLRILNGSHAAISYPSALMDIYYVHDAIRDRLIKGYLDKLVHEEIIPTIPQIYGFSFDHYYEVSLERFSNEAIGDTIPRLCFDGSNRQPKFILPTLQVRLDAGHSVEGLALESALWCRYCYGKSDSGRKIEDNDPHWYQLTLKSTLAKEDPLVWLQMDDIYGPLSNNAVFRGAFTNALNTLWRDGTKATLEAYLST